MWVLLWYLSQPAYMKSHVILYSLFPLTPCCHHAVVVDVVIKLASANGKSRHSLLTSLTYVLLLSWSHCRFCCGFRVSQHAWIFMSLSNLYSHLLAIVRHVVVVVVVNESASAHGEPRYSIITPLTYSLLSSCSHFRCRCRYGYCCDVRVSQRIWIFTSLANYLSHLRAVLITQSLLVWTFLWCSIQPAHMDSYITR